jgi:hypothetical protein
VNVHGFWSRANARNRKDQSVYRSVPHAPPGRLDPQLMPQGTWQDHPDRDATARAMTAKCHKHEVKT